MMLPAILLAKLGFTSVIAFIFSQLAFPSPSFLQVWSMPTLPSYEASLGLLSIPSLEAWPLTFSDTLSYFSLPLVTIPASTTSLIVSNEWDTCDWVSQAAPYSWFQAHLNATGRCRSRWSGSNEDGLENGNLGIRRAVKASLMDNMARAIATGALSTSSMNFALVKDPFTTAGTICSIEDEPHSQVQIRNAPLFPGMNSAELRAPREPRRSQAISSPTSPNALRNPLFYVTAACPVHAQYALPLFDVATLPLLNHVGHARDGTDSSSQVLSDIPDGTDASNARSLPLMLSRHLLERLIAKALVAGLRWAFCTVVLGGIFFMIFAYMFALSVLFGMSAIFTSLRRADRFSSPPNSKFIYAVQVSCVMSDFVAAFDSTLEIEDWSSQNLSMEPPMEPRQIRSELVLMAMVDEHFKHGAQSLIDWETENETRTALDEPTTTLISSTPEAPETAPTNPPLTPDRPIRGTRARRETSLSMSPSVISHSRPSPDPFALAAGDPLDSPLEGDMQFPDDHDGSFGFGDPDSSPPLFTSMRGAPSDRSASIGEELEHPLPPTASSLDPFLVADDNTSSTLDSPNGSYSSDEPTPSLDSTSDLLSFSIQDDAGDNAEEPANGSADESFVESTNFWDYFESRGMQFHHIDIYRPARMDNDGDTPLLSTAIVLQSEPAMMECKDMSSDRVTWVPAMKAKLAIPVSFKATMNRVRMSMMLVTCVAAFISMDPPTLDFGSHRTFWSKIVDIDIDISGSPRANPPFRYKDYDFKDDENRFELIADDEVLSIVSQPSSAISSRHGGAAVQRISDARLLAWRSPTPSCSSYNKVTFKGPKPDATAGNFGDGSDGANGVSGCVNQSNETPLTLPPGVRQLSATSSTDHCDTLPVLDPGQSPTASGFAYNCPSDVNIARHLSDFPGLDGPLNPNPFECAVPALRESTDVRHVVAPEEESVSPSLEVRCKDDFSSILQTFNSELGIAASSFAEDGFFGPDGSYASELTNEREETPSMISDSSSSARFSASPEFSRLSSSLDLGEILKRDGSLSEAALFTPPKRSNSELNSCDSEVIKRHFGFNRGHGDGGSVADSSSSTSPKAKASSPVRRRKPFASRNDNIEPESLLVGGWGS